MRKMHTAAPVREGRDVYRVPGLWVALLPKTQTSHKSLLLAEPLWCSHLLLKLGLRVSAPTYGPFSMVSKKIIHAYTHTCIHDVGMHACVTEVTSSGLTRFVHVHLS